MNKEHTPADWAERQKSFEQWFGSPLGRRFISDQQNCVRHQTDDLVGARQLVVSVTHQWPLAPDSDFAERIVATPRWQPDMPKSVVVCDADELPFPGNSMDLVILHHTPDFSAWPHQVVREAFRVLRGGGQLLVIGFNPISLWGLRKAVTRNTAGPWGGRFMFRSRMEDWLSLLDFTVEESTCHFYSTTFRGRRYNRRRQESDQLLWSLPRRGLHLLPLGAYYSIRATKRVCAPVARKPAWRRKNVVGMPATPQLGASRGYRYRHTRDQD